MSSVYSKLTIKQKADRYAYLKKWRQARKKKPFVSILDREVIPPIKQYKKREIVEIVEEDLEVSEDEDLPKSDSESESDDEMISTLYEKTPQLKALDKQLKNKLERLGFDTTEKVSKVFNTFLNINQRYGIPPLEDRTPKRLEDFYSTAILNLG